MSVQIAVAGATGSVGIPIINELLQAGHLVTALIRNGSNSASNLPQHTNLNVIEVDFNSVASLAAALQNHDVVIAALPVATPIGSQDALIDAAVAAGVRRFFPSDFGTNTDNDKCSKLPVFENKMHALQYLKVKTAAHPDFSYTVICNGAILDWGLGVGFLAHPKTHTAVIYNDGNLPFSTTTLSTISKAVVAAISHLDETKNRHVYIHDAVITQNKLIELAKKIDGKEWQLTYVDQDEVSAEAHLEYRKTNADVKKGTIPLLEISVLGKGYGGDFSEHLDNELLGIQTMSDEELGTVIAKYL